MKFSEMPYARPDLAAVKQQFADLLARFKAAATYAEAHAVFLEEEKLLVHHRKYQNDLYRRHFRKTFE